MKSKVTKVNYASNESMRNIRTNKNFLKFVTFFLQYIPKDPRLKCLSNKHSNGASMVNDFKSLS